MWLKIGYGPPPKQKQGHFLCCSVPLKIQKDVGKQERAIALRFGDGAFSYKPGAYVLLRPAFVAPDATTLDPDDEDILAELEERQEVGWVRFFFF